MNIYCAGASKEITRIERWVKRLKESRINVVSTWIDVIRIVGQANPTDALPEQYKAWAEKDLAEVRSADILWLFLPECETIGAYVELGYAFCAGKMICASGKHRPIFTNGLAKYHSYYDAEIFDFLFRLDRTTDSGPSTDDVFNARSRGA